MKQKDNEIHRGPPESTPTLEQNNPIVGSDIHLVKDTLSTADQDAATGEDPAQRDRKAQKKKRSRLSRALKLVASCATAVAIITTISAPPKPDIPEELPLWPIYDTYHIYHYAAENANTVQASLDGKSYRFSTLQDGHYLQWESTDKEYSDDPHCTLKLTLYCDDLNCMVYLLIRTEPFASYDGYEPIVELLTDTGEPLYVLYRGIIESPQQSIGVNGVDILPNLADYISVSEATDDGWGYVQIGNTMYSETSAFWNGLTYMPFSGGRYVVGDITTPSEAGYREEDLLCERDINGIHWRFYFRTEPHDTDYDGKVDECLIHIIFVPDQEEIAITQFASVLLDDRGFPAFEDNLLQTLQSSEELRHSLREGLLDIVEYDINGLKYYHLLEDMPASE